MAADSNHKNPWRVLASETPYENPWIRVDHHDVENPKGGPGIYGVVHFKNLAIGVVPLDEEEHTWLVGQYRFPLQRYSWEIPEGGCPHGEDPVTAGQRELREEVGLVAAQWMPLLQMHLSNSVSDEHAYLYLARGITMTQSEPEDTEDLRVRRVPLKEAFAMVERGDITDAMSVAALQRLQIMKVSGIL